MRCKECEDSGQKSKIYLGIATATCIGWMPGYYDEEGNWVFGKNPNTITQAYRCSNGHRWHTET